MKHTLLFLLIFSASSVFAQLSVTSSAEAEHYLYVENRLLYVEQEINIDQKDPGTKSGIYLRNNAGLLQGETDYNKNTGTGKLSVYQRGTSSAYDYNYWSLPVAVRSTEQSLIDYIFAPEDVLNSEKVSLSSDLNGKSDPLQISNRWLYAFSGTGYSNWQYLGNQFDLFPGEGFSMKGVNGLDLRVINSEAINPGNAQLYDFRGIPNNGLIEIPIKKDQILLIGNPYPSLFDLDRFLLENKATTGIAYFWDSKAEVNSHYLSDYVGGYGTYSPGLRQYAPPIFRNESGAELFQGAEVNRSPSPIGQGFMVIGKQDGIIRFTNNQRIYKGDDQIPIFKTSQRPSSTTLTLKITFNALHEKNLVLGFDERSTDQVDHGMDAKSIEQKSNDIFWNLNDINYVINVQPKIDEKLIPLLLQLKEHTQVEFSISDLQNFDPDRVFIYDAEQNLYFGIRSGSLSLSLSEGNYKNRFYLSFIEKLPPQEEENPEQINENENNEEQESAAEESTEDNNTQDAETEDLKVFDSKPPRVLLNSIEIFQNNKQEQLEIKLFYDSWITQIRIYDLQGKQVYQQVLQNREKEFLYPTGNLSNAIYIVKVKTNDQIEISKKVRISN
ncbi:T9SS type A sorting domain-containing protein [Christiangramia sp. ASW11-125]|uniref:T9SS type A sorting domain-containing protein n=1 Tax=Christiangramia sp. ASW11-125 TaxID=3400701 RepID=UPI003AAA4511